MIEKEQIQIKYTKKMIQFVTCIVYMVCLNFHAMPDTLTPGSRHPNNGQENEMKKKRKEGEKH